jgi:hypothetical protein
MDRRVRAVTRAARRTEETTMAKATLTFAIYQAQQSVGRQTTACDIIRIGKDPRSHLRIDDEAASRMHAVIEIVDPNRFTVIDLGNEPGTLVNGAQIDKCALRVGDEIRIGETRLVLESAAIEKTTASVPAAVAQRPLAPATTALPRADAALRFDGFAAAPINPFAAAAARADREPLRVADDADPSTYTYSLVKSGPDVSPEEVEVPGLSSVEVMVLWGNNVLHVDHLTPPRSYTVGEAAGCDCFLPAEKLGTTLLRLVQVEGDTVRVALPTGARGTLEVPGRERTTLDGAQPVALPPKARARIELDGFAFHVTAGNAGRRVPRGLAASRDYTVASYFGMSLLAHAGFIATLAFFVPPMNVTDDESIDQSRIIQIQAYLAAAAERDRPVQETQEDPTPQAQDRPGGTGAAHVGESGAMGKPTATARNKHYQVKQRNPNDETYLGRQAALREAREFGMIGLLTTGIAGNPDEVFSPKGRESANGRDTQSSLGTLWGLEPGEAHGFGGLGLSGIGEGGGGRGEGIGLGEIGGLGMGAGTGTGQGFGPGGGSGFSTGRLQQAHVPKGPGTLRIGPTTISGRLPPEVIQRVVRQNFGRFRLCYERGLAQNPNLQGRVSVRFVIDRNGAVSNATNGGSDLPSVDVVGCVVRSYYGLSFPQPEGGIVTVVYPIMFSPG